MPPESPTAPTTVARYYLLLFQDGDRQDPFGDLNRAVLPMIQDRLESAIATDPAQTEIDVWIESPGGDAHAAYKLFLELRHRCRKLRAVIPDYAKSAATLLVLGADEIFMAPSAELGPLDAQIEHPDREGITISALDVARAFGFLGDFALDYLIASGAQVVRYTELPRVDVLREVARFSAMLLRPAVSKLDPHLIHRAANQLDIALQYARTILRKRNLAPEDEHARFDAGGLAHHLIEHYPAHGFVIDRQEAAKLLLPVRPAENYHKWKEVKSLHHGFHRGVFASEDSRSIIDVWDDERLEQMFREEQEANGDISDNDNDNNQQPRDQENADENRKIQNQAGDFDHKDD